MQQKVSLYCNEKNFISHGKLLAKAKRTCNARFRADSLSLNIFFIIKKNMKNRLLLLANFMGPRGSALSRVPPQLGILKTSRFATK